VRLAIRITLEKGDLKKLSFAVVGAAALALACGGKG
jgi:hypothetical protein